VTARGDVTEIVDAHHVWDLAVRPQP